MLASCSLRLGRQTIFPLLSNRAVVGGLEGRGEGAGLGGGGAGLQNEGMGLFSVVVGVEASRTLTVEDEEAEGAFFFLGQPPELAGARPE